MKKLAIISGLLFFIVYLCVNTFMTDENALDVINPSAPVRSLSESDNNVTPGMGDPDTMTKSNIPTNYSYLIVASFNDIEKANRVADEYGDKYNIDMHVLPSAANGITGSAMEGTPPLAKHLLCLKLLNRKISLMPGC